MTGSTGCYDYSEIAVSNTTDATASVPTQRPIIKSQTTHHQSFSPPRKGTSLPPLQKPAHRQDDSMYYEMEIIDEEERRQLSRLYRVLSKLTFWKAHKRHSKSLRTRSIPVVYPHSPGPSLSRNTTASCSTGASWSSGGSTPDSPATIGSSSSSSSSSAGVGSNENHQEKGEENLLVVSSTPEWWEETAVVENDHDLLLPPQFKAEQEENEKKDAIVIWSPFAKPEQSVRALVVEPNDNNLVSEMNQLHEEFNAECILEEIEEFSQAMSIAESVTSVNNKIEDHGNHEADPEAQTQLQQDVISAEDLASVEQDLSVWWRVRDRFRKTFQGVFRPSSSVAPTTTSRRSSNNSPKRTPPPLATTMETLESTQLDETATDNGHDQSATSYALQLNHEADGVVEVSWPVSANSHDNVDVSRIEEEYPLSDVNVAQHQQDEQSLQSTVGEATALTSLSVALDPKDHCAQLVLVRSLEEGDDAFPGPQQQQSLPRKQHRRGNGSNNSGFSSLDLSSCSASSILLNELPLGASFPFSYQETPGEKPSSRGDQVPSNSTDSPPTYIDPQVEYPSRPRVDLQIKDYEYHLASDSQSLHDVTQSLPRSYGERDASKATTITTLNTPPGNAPTHDFPANTYTYQFALNDHPKGTFSNSILPPPSLVGGEAGETTVTSLTIPVPSTPSNHQRQTSIDSIWADLEEENGTPFDEPSNEETMNSPARMKQKYQRGDSPRKDPTEPTLMGMVHDRWFQGMLRFSQNDMGMTGGLCTSGKSSSSVPSSIPVYKDESLDTSVLSAPSFHSQEIQKPSFQEFISPTLVPTSRQNKGQDDTSTRLSSLLNSQESSAFAFFDLHDQSKRGGGHEARLSPPLENSEFDDIGTSTGVFAGYHPSSTLPEFDPTDIDNYASAAAESATYEKPKYACYPYGGEDTTYSGGSSSAQRRRRRHRRQASHGSYSSSTHLSSVSS